MILTYDRVFPAATPADQREENLRAAREGRRPRVFMQRKDMQTSRPNVPTMGMHGLGLLPGLTSIATAAGIGPMQYVPPTGTSWQNTMRAGRQFLQSGVSPSSSLNDPGFAPNNPPTLAQFDPTLGPGDGAALHPQGTALMPGAVVKSPPWYSQPWAIAAVGVGGLAIGAGAVWLLRR